MKRRDFTFCVFIALLFLSAVVSAQNFSWTWQNPLPTGADHNDAVVLNSNDFFLFGNGSSILHSTDAGVTWNAANVDTGARDIYEATFVNQTVGYVVGTGGLIMKTTDGGSSWIEQPSGTSVVLWYVDFVNPDTGLAVGASGTILKTTNGGLNWTPSTYGTAILYKVHFVNDTLIYLGSSSTTTGRLIRSTDAGTTWQDISASVTGLTGTVRGIHFVDKNLGFISNSAGRIYKTTDGGTTWAESYFIGSTTATIYEVKFVDASTGFAISTVGQVVRTTDAGVSWTLTQTPATENLFGLGITGVTSKSGVNSLLAGGDLGTIVKSLDNGVTWTLVGSAASREQLLRGSFPTSSLGYVVGGSITTGNSFGDVLKTTDGGSTWNKLAFNPGYRIYSVFFLNENLGYVGSQGPTGLYRTTDGGQNWTQLNTGIGTSTNIIYDIDFYNENFGFALYSSGSVARTTNGGQTWSSISAGWTAAAIYDMFMIDSLNIYIVGPGGRVSRSTDAGNSFVQLASLGTATLYSIFFTAPTTGFITASGGRIYKTTDGLSFSEIPNPLSSTIYAIRFINSQTGWIGGSSGDVYYTQDGGTTWVESHVRLGSTQSIRDIQIKGSDLWLIGTDGLIIKGFSDPTVPVELTSFAGSVVDGAVELSWITITETNNSGFEVQSKSAAHAWKSLDFIPGNGTTTRPQSYSFIDKSPAEGLNYYRVKQIDFDGSFEFSPTIEVDVNSPNTFSLEQNYPNPFNPSTNIQFATGNKQFVSLKVFDVLGNEVATLVNEEKPAGNYEIKLDASLLTSGVYFYSLRAGAFTATKKLILLK